MGESLSETKLIQAKARGGRKTVRLAERRILRAAPDGEDRADGVAEARIDEQRVRSEAVHKDDQMALVGRSAGWAEDIGAPESHGVAQLAQQPREREIELKTKTSPVFLDELAETRVDVERW